MVQKLKDPVCGMEVSPEDAVATEDHDGQTFYFCSHACHKAFVKDPHLYGHPADQSDHGGHST